MQPASATLPTFPLNNDRSKFVVTALNGGALYVLAYYIVWGLHQGAKLGVSNYLHLRGNLDPSRLIFTMGDGEWWRTAIIAVHGIGPAGCLVLGGLTLWWFWTSERAKRGNFKLLLLWITFHCYNLVFGALLADTLLQTGSWYVIDWLFNQGNAFNILVAVLSGLLQMGLGYFSAAAFLQAHDSKTVMRFPNRRRMIIFTLILPWVAGSIFIGLTKTSYFSLYEALHLVTMGLLVIPIAHGCLSELFSSTVRRPQITRIAWGLVTMAVVVAVAWRLALSPPVSFGG